MNNNNEKWGFLGNEIIREIEFVRFMKSREKKR